MLKLKWIKKAKLKFKFAKRSKLVLIAAKTTEIAVQEGDCGQTAIAAKYNGDRGDVSMTSGGQPTYSFSGNRA